MKKNIHNWAYLLLLVAFVSINSCRPNYPELVEPLSVKTTYLKGTWKASKVTQYDQEAIDNGFPVSVQQQDITSNYPFSDYTIVFNLDAQGKPSTYTLTPGTAPNYLALTSGNWSVDHPVFATKIMFTDPNITTAGKFVVKMIDKNRLTLRMERRDAASPNPDPDKRTMFLFYEYEFTRQ